jgi:hypothetical protein
MSSVECLRQLVGERNHIHAVFPRLIMVLVYVSV